MLGGQGNELVDIVGLVLCLVGRLVSLDLPALGATVYDDISLLGVGDAAYRLHRRAAFVCAVSGVYINVQRPETHGAVITRGIAQMLYRGSAMGADKTVIVF